MPTSPKLLDVDEVTKLWRCHRVTVLRLMRRGTLHWVEVDGEPRFDEAEVLALKNPNIGVFPHLTVTRAEEPVFPSLPEAPQLTDEWMGRYQQIAAQSEELFQQTRSLLENSRVWLNLSRMAGEQLLAEQKLVRPKPNRVL